MTAARRPADRDRARRVGRGSGRRLGRGAGLVAAGLLAAAATFAVAPPRTPPLYDGVAAPDEPYRYTHPAAGSSARPAVGASIRIPVSGGRVGSASLATPENGPQLAYFHQDAGLVVAAGATAVTVTATPVDPPLPLPSGTVLSNAYRLVAVDSAGRPAQIAPGDNKAVVQMRIPRSTNAPVVIEDYTPGAGWVALPGTIRSGQDIYGASLPHFGVLAAVEVSAGAALAAHAGRGHGGVSAGLVAGVVVLAVLVLLALVRLARRNGPAAEPAEPQSAPDGPP